MNEDDVQAFLRHPLTMIASDGGPRKFGEDVPHPRSYGNNARALGRYVRELKVLTIEDAIRRMTSLPAQTFHLSDRGILKPGAWADIVIFDPDKVNDPSTFTDPHHYAEGFSDVIVNGEAVIRDGAQQEGRRQEEGEFFHYSLSYARARDRDPATGVNSGGRASDINCQSCFGLPWLSWRRIHRMRITTKRKCRGTRCQIHWRV